MASCGDPVRNNAKHLSTLVIALVVISWALLFQRFFCKITAKTTLGFDDWFILVTAIGSMATSIVNIQYVFPNGLGKDVWTLEPRTIYHFGFYFYIATSLYLLQITTLKLAMLFFYLRIFPSKRTRRVIWFTIAIVCSFGLAFTLVSIVPCRPISHFWNMWDGEHEGQCLNAVLVAWMNAVISIVLSFWMIIIPLWKLKSLNLRRSKKIGVAAMFILGTFDTIVSIIRLSSLIDYGNNYNHTRGYAPVVKWSTIEVNVGIICVCMPTARLVLVKFCSKLASTTPVYYEQNELGSSGSKAQGHGWPMDPIIMSPCAAGSYGPGKWQVSSGEVRDGNDIHLSGEILKPENGILYTKAFIATYKETDEQELISPWQGQRRSWGPDSCGRTN